MRTHHICNINLIVYLSLTGHTDAQRSEIICSMCLTGELADGWKVSGQCVAAVVARLCASIRYSQKYANDI